MSKLINIDNEYKLWITDICLRFRQSQIRAAVRVNSELLRFYWLLGKDIEQRQFTNKYGTAFYEQLSLDLKNKIPGNAGFSATNLKYAYYFYTLYNQLDEIRPQVADEFNENRPQVADDLFNIPWGHHRLIIDKCKGDARKAYFYVRETIEYGWSRAMLLNFLDTNLYQAKGNGITNFKKRLPDYNGDLAQELTKDPYNFDFLTLAETHKEKELETALVDNITRFLIELGNGFAFMGNQYRIVVGGDEFFIDLLFYNVKLHAYCVVELKATAFSPEHLGQLSFYVSAVDKQLCGSGDNPTIGLLICKEKNDIVARYALDGVAQPLGVSEYQLGKLLPENYRSSLPSIEEIERELSNI